MKKITITIFIFQLLLLFGCVTKTNNNNKITETDVFFSKYYECIDPVNNLLELYNNGSKSIDLSTYEIKIYKDGSNLPTSNFELSGELKSKEFYLINSLDNTKGIEANISFDLRYSGNDTVTLYKDDKLVDIIGTIGISTNFAADVTLVKKLEYLNGYSVYEPYYYIPYITEYFDILGSLNYMSEQELLEGPKLTGADLSKPFALTDTTAGGGVITVKLQSCVDGDTARFTYPSETGIANGTKVRFFNIDTRETMSNNTQEWGVPAKNYTCERLQNAKVIQLQSIENNSIYETYERILANVWVDGELLNHTIAKKGYSDVAFGTNPLIYNNISYTGWLLDAVNYSTLNKLGIHGEKDPFWDYTELKPIS